MIDPREIQELKAQIALDKHKYSEIERPEAELWKTSLHKELAQSLRN
jgi:uncharacterized small protein (DUF1192 family)